MLNAILGPLVVTMALAGAGDELCPGCLARAEAREMLEEADRDGDGKLDLDELSDWIQRCRAEEEDEDEDDDRDQGRRYRDEEDEDEDDEGMDEDEDDDDDRGMEDDEDEDEDDDDRGAEEDDDELSAPLPGPI